MSVRRRKHALWVATALSWVVAITVVWLAIREPEDFAMRTWVMVSLAVAAMLFSAAAVVSLVTAPDVAYRLGYSHAVRACHCGQPELRTTGADPVVVPFARADRRFLRG